MDSETMQLLHAAFNRLAPNGKVQEAFNQGLSSIALLEDRIMYAVQSIADGLMYGNWPSAK